MSVIFYAAFGKGISPEKIGGAEQGCIKTQCVLEKNRYKVIRLDKPVLNGNKLKYFIKVFFTWLKLIFLLLKNRKSVLHIAGFYRKVLYIEFLMIKTAKILGHKVIYEIRNGGMIEDYNKRNNFYHCCLAKTFASSNMILCQGKEYIPFVEKISGKASFWYPNYLMDTFLDERNRHKHLSDNIGLVFFGRIVPAKNIGVMISILHLLREKGICCHLDLIGGYSEEYYYELKGQMENNGLDDSSVKFWGRMTMEKFYPILQKDHFFVFPSTEEREGHSNSLTEAIGCGLVSVVSSAGFNRSIVGCDELVVDGTDPAKYAEIIYGIIKSNRFEKLSAAACERIEKNFTESIVSKKLLEVYNSL